MFSEPLTFNISRIESSCRRRQITVGRRVTNGIECEARKDLYEIILRDGDFAQCFTLLSTFGLNGEQASAAMKRIMGTKIRTLIRIDQMEAHTHGAHNRLPFDVGANCSVFIGFTGIPPILISIFASISLISIAVNTLDSLKFFFSPRTEFYSNFLGDFCTNLSDFSHTEAPARSTLFIVIAMKNLTRHLKKGELSPNVSESHILFLLLLSFRSTNTAAHSTRPHASCISTQPHSRDRHFRCYQTQSLRCHCQINFLPRLLQAKTAHFP